MTIPSTVRAVFFDAVGTLIHPEPSAAEVYARVGQIFGSRLAQPDIASRFAVAFRRQEEIDRERGWRTNEERELVRWRSIVAEVLDDVSDAEACFRALFDHFAWPDAWRCEEDVGSMLDVLAERGYLLGVASNFDARLHSVVAGLPELQPLRYRVISSEVGWRKPAPQFFRRLSEVSGLQQEQLLHVGDDRENDYEGARAAGLHALLFEPRQPRRLGDLVGHGL
jgi:putative hydrolase of the HAD superfamily